jgi:hypothetical protein
MHAEANVHKHASSPLLPPLPHRVALLNRFTTLHSWSIQKAFYAALTCRGGVNNFGYMTQFLQFEVEYRPECGGNPGIAYRIKNGEFHPFEELHRSPLKTAFDAGRLMREESEARLRATKEDFVGVLIVVWVMDDYHLCCAHPMSWNGVQWDKAVMQLHPSEWLQLLRGVVEKGYILQPIENDPIGWHPGEMVKVGDKWKWQRYSDKELEDMGLKNRNKKFPGLVF